MHVYMRACFYIKYMLIRTVSCHVQIRLHQEKVVVAVKLKYLT